MMNELFPRKQAPRRRKRRRSAVSWKRLLGFTRARQEFARQTGIPTTRTGMERKVGRYVTKGGCFVVVVILIVLILVVRWILSQYGINLDALDSLLK